MTQMYDPHKEWDEEMLTCRYSSKPPLQNVPGSITEKLEQALTGYNKPLQNMTDRAHDRD